MKYTLPRRNITNYIPTIVSILLMTIAQLMFITEANSQSRPYDNTEISVLKKGGLQSDSYFSKNNGEYFDIVGLNTMLRYGLTKNLELQVEWQSNKTMYDNINLDGYNEVTTIGLKMHLNDDGDILPALSAVFTTNFTLDTDYRLFLPRLDLLFEKKITSSFNVNGNFEVQLDESSGDIRTDYAFNLEADITNWQTTYIGVTGNSNRFNGENVPYENYLEIGMLFYVYEGIVLYPFYDIGLNDYSGDIINIGALFTLGK